MRDRGAGRVPHHHPPNYASDPFWVEQALWTLLTIQGSPDGLAVTFFLECRQSQ